MAKRAPRGKRANRCYNDNVHTSDYRQRMDSPRFPTFIQQCSDDRPAELNLLLAKSNLIGDSIFVQGSSRAVSVTPTGEKLFMAPGKDLAITLRDEVFCTKLPRGDGDIKTKACETNPKEPARSKENIHPSKTSARSNHSKPYRKGSANHLSGRVKNTERFNQYCHKRPITRPVLPDDLLQSWSLTKYINVSTQTRPGTPRMQETFLLEALGLTPGVLAHYRIPMAEDLDERRPQSWCNRAFHGIISIFTVIILIVAFMTICYEFQLPQHFRMWYMGPDVRPKTKMAILKELLLLLLDL